jgi:iron complex outermembrane receptor protein
MNMGKQGLRRLSRTAFCASVLLIICPLSVLADGPAGAETEKLIDLSLEELLQVKVTTFSRHPTALSKTPAAIFVMSQTDIQRSGARTIPDLLRMVPGVAVAQIDANTWAVTARGSNGVFANKLLVLMDGRTLYNPLFSGVYWEIQDTDLSSIERIEVIRGPGATMWGSNAVNGVINIITKKAKDTQGGRVEVVTGTETNLETTVRYGGEAGHMQYRTYVKYFDRDGYADDSYDDWDFSRIGGRLDWSDDTNDEITVIGEWYSGDVGENILTNSPVLPYSVSNNVDREYTGGFASMDWDRALSEDSAFKLKLYYDHYEIDNIPPEETRDTFEFDFQHNFSFASRHDVIWGLGYRHSEDDTVGSFTVGLDPASRTQRLYSGFIQDEIRLTDDIYLALGTRVEKNNFTSENLEWSPNARLSWQTSDTSMLWGSVARAIRSPSRMEQAGHIVGVMLPPFVPVPPLTPGYPIPSAITINGDPDFDSEDVVAYELGFRSQPFDAVTLDLALFFNHYEDLRVGEFVAPLCEPSGIPVTDPLNPACFAPVPPPYVNLPLTFFNRATQDNWGAELSVTYLALEWWRLDGAYSYLNVDDPPVLPFSVGEDSPEHQFSLRSAMQVTDSLDFDLWLRYVDELEKQGVSSYTVLDSRLSYLATPSLRLSVVGRNLLESEHEEFREEFGLNERTQVPREAYVEIQWQF